MTISANWALWLVRKEASRRPFWLQRRICLLVFSTGFIGHTLRISFGQGAAIGFDFLLILIVVSIISLNFLWYYSRRQVSSDSRLLGEAEQGFDSRTLRLWKGIRAAAAGIQSALLSLIGTGFAWIFHTLSGSWVFVWWSDVLVGGAIGLVVGVAFLFDRRTQNVPRPG